MNANTIPAHLTSTCEAACTDAHCPQMVKQATTGRWFITIGHAGFNSATNNGAGYKTKDTAYQAAYTYLCRSGRKITSTAPKTADLIAWEAAREAKRKNLQNELHMYHCAGGHTRSEMARSALILAGFRFEGDSIYWPDGVKLTYVGGNIDYREGQDVGVR